MVFGKLFFFWVWVGEVWWWVVGRGGHVFQDPSKNSRIGVGMVSVHTKSCFFFHFSNPHLHLHLRSLILSFTFYVCFARFHSFSAYFRPMVASCTKSCPFSNLATPNDLPHTFAHDGIYERPFLTKKLYFSVKPSSTCPQRHIQHLVVEICLHPVQNRLKFALWASQVFEWFQSKTHRKELGSFDCAQPEMKTKHKKKKKYINHAKNEMISWVASPCNATCVVTHECARRGRTGCKCEIGGSKAGAGVACRGENLTSLHQDDAFPTGIAASIRFGSVDPLGSVTQTETNPTHTIHANDSFRPTWILATLKKSLQRWKITFLL